MGYLPTIFFDFNTWKSKIAETTPEPSIGR